MSLRRNVFRLEKSLRPPPSLRNGSASSAARSYATETSTTASPDHESDYAVLGGGITGLATAYWLAKDLPKSKISLFEASPNLGGWMKSKLVDVGNGEVIFERGPRSLRPQYPNGALGLVLAKELGIADDILVTATNSPAAQRRYIYYPDHLVRMPGPGMGFWETTRSMAIEPVFSGLPAAIAREGWVDKRPDTLADESIASFISRRFHKNISDNIASALFHGIYAGDVNQLSIKSIAPLIWAREEKEGSLSESTLKALFKGGSWEFLDDLQTTRDTSSYDFGPELRQKMRNCSVYSFKYGMEQLAESLESWLEERSNVKIYKSAKVIGAAKVEDSEKISLSLEATSSSPDTQPTNHSTAHVVSTIASTASSFLTPSFTEDPTAAVTVAVINMYYHPFDPDFPSVFAASKYPLLRGFGYLIPASVPFEQNPERALGVIFDSEITPDAYSTVPPQEQGTKLTVMMGGHWWDGWTAYPSQEECKDMAQKVLARHLGIMAKPTVCEATIQRECIPQYHVGHSERMLKAHDDLLRRWSGKVRVAGSWYTGVGVNDCLRSAWDITEGLKHEAAKGSADRVTGLERVAKRRKMALVKRYKLQGMHTEEIVKTD